MPWIEFERDWNPRLPLVIQAVGLVAHRLAIGASRQDVLNEQRYLRAGSRPQTLEWLFHNAVVKALESQLRALARERDDGAGISDDED
ncbi:hypothetical protein B0T20DRAFT_481021 [Sordaria brevicollis]|uniref:Uncharacterized protein n=1 Tax=Sordaria brevicollis TaxID=83679 RepID=A0AAE0PA60_SORBR|nr:hypothetical protein B0T20DRAFT_481021 [Sordaria brevicollis]